jgi:hypothetical protein
MKPNTPLLQRRPGWRGLSLDAVAPDGVPVVVEWEHFHVGTSVFIPALNHRKLRRQMESVAQQLGYTLKGYSRIEAGKYGMRFWRTA